MENNKQSKRKKSTKTAARFSLFLYSTINLQSCRKSQLYYCAKAVLAAVGSEVNEQVEQWWKLSSKRKKRCTWKPELICLAAKRATAMAVTIRKLNLMLQKIQIYVLAPSWLISIKAPLSCRPVLKRFHASANSAPCASSTTTTDWNRSDLTCLRISLNPTNCHCQRSRFLLTPLRSFESIRLTSWSNKNFRILRVKQLLESDYLESYFATSSFFRVGFW
jgi:hypothetical protein